MTDSNSSEPSTDRWSNRSGISIDRRNVLQGIGAFGLGTGVLGSVQAKENDGGPSRSGPAATDVPVSAQFWSFTEADLSVAELIHECADAGYDAVEPHTLDDEDAIATALEEADVRMGSAHVDIDEIEADPEGVVETYSQFGEPALIEPYIDGETWSTEASVVEFAERVNGVADEVADLGLEFGYHNHDHEFEQLEDGDEIAFDVFAEHIEDHVHLQIDVGWVATGGENPIEYITNYADNVRSIHMKNMKDGEFVEIDEGEVNMKAVANVARAAADVDYLIYEYDQAPEPLESMAYGAEFLDRWSGPRGRGK
ncbi:sugar phosphate isomerase/epimerase family protein [Natrialbaceae archaeon A-arb3/5]